MRALALFLVLLGATSGAADDSGALSRLIKGPTVTVTEVVDGDTVIVAPPPEGAAQIRLVGIQAPKLPLGRQGFKAWPLSADAKRMLERMVLNRRVTLYFGGAAMDRHSRHLAHLARDDGLWVQGAMLARGMARVYTFPDNRKLAAEMYAHESAARTERLGIWSLGFYRPREADPGPLLSQLGTFQLVEGTVLSAARVKGRVYLNFGDNWRDDFTATLSPKAARLYAGTAGDPLDLEGRRIRARGWLRKRNGPMIEITHPEQLEILADGN